MSEAEKTEKSITKVVKADFSDSNVVRFMLDAAHLAKKADVRSAFIMTVDANGHVDWMQVYESEHHGLLLMAAMEDARADLKSEIFGEYLDD